MIARITSAAYADICADTARAHPNEACGLLFGRGDLITATRRAENVAPTPARAFEIAPGTLFSAYRAARKGGPEVIGCYHSHPNHDPQPSVHDAARAYQPGWIWIIAAGGALYGYRANEGGTLHARFDRLELQQQAAPSGRERA